VPQNKGMKQTSVEHIGRSQLIPGVGRTVASSGRTNSGLTGVHLDARRLLESLSSIPRG